MKKLFLGVWFVMQAAFAAAEEDASWSDVYAQTVQAYVQDTDIEKLAVTALKGIQKVDNDLRIGNDNNRLTLYYRGKVVKVLRKPQDKNDAIAWGKLTENMIEAAVVNSAKASERDFEITEALAAAMTAVLDKDSKFYGSLDEFNATAYKNKRSFAARLEEQILYLKITAFNKQTLREFLQALQDYSEAETLVIDLRGCPGGMAGEAIKIAELVLDGGIIASAKERNLNREVYYTAPAGDIWQGKEIFVLVDGVSASAAELLAAVLQEQGRAKVIGTSTKGKGTMQKLIAVGDQGVLAVTSGFFMMPSGKELNNNGIHPDICTFEMPEAKNPAVLIERQIENCGAEPRSDSGLEMEIVKFIKAKETPL